MSPDHADNALRDARDVLHALDLPGDAIVPWLQHVEAFCTAHGGERHYAALLALVRRYQGIHQAAACDGNAPP